jgi:hypothetical protein
MIDGLQKEYFRSPMKHPTCNVKDKVHNEENGDKGNTLQNERGYVPMQSRPAGHRFIIPNPNHETNDQTPKRESFSE